MSLTENSITIDFKESAQIYKEFQAFYPKKNIKKPYQYNKSLSTTENLSNLSIHLLDDHATICDLFAYKPLIVELVARLISLSELERRYLSNKNIKTTIDGSRVLSSLSLLVTHCKEISILVEYFLESKNFFHSLENCLSSIFQTELQSFLLSFYRLISTDRQKFYRFIHPQILYTIISSNASTNINKYISILILSQYLFLAEDAKTQMIDQNIKQEELLGYFDGDENVNYKFLPLLEAQRSSNLSKLTPLVDCVSNTLYSISFSEQDISPGVSIIAGILVPNLTSLVESSRANLTEPTFVPITKSLKAMRTFAAYLKTSEPVLLIGKEGSGKTFLVNEIAKTLNIENSNNLIKIHLNQQTDSKMLLGTYTSGSKPGTFEWKNGVLTTAVKEGKWVLVEDIDKAPNEVLSILMSLLENRQLTIPSRGEVIKAANGFQLISTIRSQNRSNHFPDIIGLRLWKALELEDLDSNDLKIILNHKFPLLTRYIGQFIKCYFIVKEIYDSRRFISMNKGAQPRQISIRDLMKFCTRCNRIFEVAGIKSSDDMIHDELFDSVFQEAIDSFTSAIVEQEPIGVLINEIGLSLEIPNSRINLQINRNVPTFEENENSLKIGRAYLEKQKIIGVNKVNKSIAIGNTTSFARTNHSVKLMEKVGVAISMCEPLLLVGETGTGKTTVVQEMAKLLNKKLTVINISQQTEVGDLLGGFKPVNAKSIALPIQEDFEELFARSFSVKNNAQYLKLLSKCFNRSQWKNVARLWKEAYKMARNTFEKKERGTKEGEDEEKKYKKKQRLNEFEKSELMKEWKCMFQIILDFEKQAIDMENSFIFRFVEGSLVKAVKNGDWLLLDEMNLASPETLDSISDLLSEQKSQRSVLLSENGDIESVKASPEFRIFGCMNPATDVGKKDLPQSIRSRFTEVYVHSPDEDISDLLMIIDKYVGKFTISDEWIGNDIAELYLAAKKLSDNNEIVDGANQKPHFSIRTLTRTLLYVRDIVSIYGLRRSLYEGFCMSFLTLLDAKSESILKPLIEKYTISRLKNSKSVLSQIPANPSNNFETFVQFRHYWMQKGPEEPEPQAHYIITPFVEKNMMNLVRASSGGRFPVLIQGPTSAGKTSMIHYLSKITGHKFVRINNHEHTDLQEYIGTYVSDDTGKLIFKEGILIEALRKGHWIVLDELNLAPTDVLEALNRLLDDNRELLIPETQEIVRPHPDFMLFATQNPPGLYGGRKVLSKAFRNRFLELHFDDIPQDELEIILKERCKIAPSYAKKIVEVYKELSVQRQSTRLFEQKNSFATLRDLFRWAQRDAIGYEQLAANGYMLLAERVRRLEEKTVVKQVLEKVMKVRLNIDKYYEDLEVEKLLQTPGPVVWTKAMRRLAVLVMTSMKNNEPLLLVGETGCGKTTVCQMIAEFFNQELIIVNAHQNTETGDLLGAQRPIRNRSELQSKLISVIRDVLAKISIEVTETFSMTDALAAWNENKNNDKISEDDAKVVEKLIVDCNALFEWNDGPLINALKKGCYFLLDEISLADDSVLERLNSVLEPERTILLAEKGSEDALVIAKDGFQFLATMNPGGDYGKKELSPALRNRFTEIWVPSLEDFEDVKQIVNVRLAEGVKHLTKPIVEFSEWYGLKMGNGNATTGVISLRDILAWVTFINCTYNNGIQDMTCLLHGASMVFIDALGTHSTAYLAESEARLRATKIEFVEELSKFSGCDLTSIYAKKFTVSIEDGKLSCGPFSIDRNENIPEVTSFNLEAPTTAINAMRVVRALQVHKPILLEGSPGVGKTSLISALAQATGNNLTRINLSEQTDLIDLFGSDSPVEGGSAGEFTWRDAPFLRAMQKGEWVLLDEMNLASQSVLEGLNACLDHRGEAYIPELDKSFASHPNFKVFAAQNPQYQGGGRKGLPKSFVNRFSVVYVEMLTETDLKLIANHLYPKLDSGVCNMMISFMSQLEEEVVIKKQWGSSGEPWEFNLRDTLRWLSLINSPSLNNEFVASDFFDLIVRHRFRTHEDREKAGALFQSIFGDIVIKDPFYHLSTKFIQCQYETIQRNQLIQYQSNHIISELQCNVNILETIFRCLKKAYPMILVGPTGSGKTELIKFTANVIGAKVYEFSMNNDVDSMDILGGYEQADVTRALSEISNSILEFFLEMVAVNVQLKIENNESILRLALSIVKLLMDNNLGKDNIDDVVNAISILNSSVDNEKLREFIVRLSELKKEIYNPKGKVSFQWFDGLLVQAVEKGHWLILDNANLCNPSVLDRLNSLLEKDGILIINECTNEDGSPRIVKPHPKFRLFLTSDPKYGELSRAMRNRGVEIYVDSLEKRASWVDRQILGLSNVDEYSQSLSERRLDDLSLNAFIKPLSAFIDPNDSELKDCAMFMDYYNLAITKNLKFATQTLLFFIPIYLIPIIDDLSQSSFNCSEIRETTIFEEISKKLKFMEKTGICDKMRLVYSTSFKDSAILKASPYNNVNNQILSPLVNSAILPLVQNHLRYVQTKETNYLFCVLSMIADATFYIDSLRARAKSAKLTSLDLVEQFAAVSFGREVKKLPKLNTYKLIVSIFEFISTSIFTTIQSNKLLNSDLIFQSLFDLLCLWQNIVLSSSGGNETAIRVYHQHALDWINNFSSLYDSALVLQLVSDIDCFTRQIKLSRGSAMSMIWNACRSKYPQTSVAWENYELLLAVATSFDEVAKKQFPESIGDVNEFRKMFIELFDECLNKDQNEEFIGMVDNIKSKVSELDRISDSFLTKRSHPFAKEFDCILGFVDSETTAAAKQLELSTDNLNLALFSSRSTFSLTKHNQFKQFNPYPRVLDSLWNSNGDIKVSLFDDESFKTVMRSAENVKYTEGGNIDETLFDLKFLINQLVKKSPQILGDHKEHFKNILINWIKFICELHNELLPTVEMRDEASRLISDLSSSSLQNYSNIFKENDQTAFYDTLCAYFIPSIKELNNGGLKKQNLGKAFVFMACGLIMLYMPDSAFDPAVVDHILYQDFLKLQKMVNEIRESFVAARTTEFGDFPIKAESYLPEVNSDKLPEAPRVHRNNEPVAGLFEEWYSFFTSYVDKEHIEFLLSVACEVNEKASAQIENFNKNASQFALRLKDNYLRYSDLNDILIGYIYSLKLGLQLLHDGSKEDEVTVTTPLWSVNAAVLSTSETLNSLFDEVKHVCKTCSISDVNAEIIYCYFLQLSNFRGDVESAFKVEDFMNQSLLALYYRWSLRMLKQKEKESTEQGVFKFSDPTVDAELDFQNLFPNAEDMIDIKSSADASSSTNLDNMYYQIARAYISNFKHNSNTSTGFEDIVIGASKVFKSLEKVNSASAVGFNSSSVLVSILSTLKEASNAFTKCLNSADIDFYRGSSAYETKKAGTIVLNLRSSVHEILMQWPEHDTLGQLFRICTEFLEYPSTTPIFRLLTKVEQIFTFIGEWEKYAHSGISLNAHFKTISSLIVSWRQLELASWKQVFKNEEDAIESNIGKWWFHLFETIIIPAINDEFYDDSVEINVVSAINIFLSQTTYGEFGYRLDLLRAFVDHVHGLVPNSPIYDSLLNVISFYSQFKPQVDEAIEATKKTLEKKVNEIILLASWKDVNVDALKQSSRRSHHNLYKVIRKYRGFLMQPVKPIVESGLNKSSKSLISPLDITMKSVELPNNIKEIIDLCSDISSWNERALRLRNISQVNKNMSIYISDIEKEYIPQLHDYAKEVLEESNRLRKETPTEFKKENKKLIASLKTEKHKLLSDTLRELKNMGLKLRMTVDIERALSSVTVILATSKSLVNTSFQGCDAYFFRLLDILPRLRVSVSDSHPDIPTGEAHKCLSAAENLIFTLVANRSVLVRSHNLSHYLNSIIPNFENFTYCNPNRLLRSSEMSSLESIVDDIEHFLQWLPRIIEYAIVSLRNASEFSNIQYDSSLFTIAKAQLEKFSVRKLELYGTLDIDQIKNISVFYSSFITDLNVWKECNKELAYVADFVLEWCSLQNFEFTKNREFSAKNSNTMEDLENSFRKLFNSILVSVQKIHKLQTDSQPIDADEGEEAKEWLISSQRKIIKYFDLLYPTHMINKFNDCINIMKSIEFSEKESLIASAMIEHMLPIINQYFNLVQVLHKKLRDNYIDISKGTFDLSTILYNITTKGFCQPEAPSEEKESDQMQEGTGLGDGEGATNNSKDIEDDEDLSEQAQQPNEEDKDRDDQQDGNDDAVDIEGDMAGNLEDAPDEEDDNDKDKEEQENEDLDEEIDDIDDMDPNAVDEKLWDEEATSNSKEKESDKMPDNSEENDEMQAIEDDTDNATKDQQQEKENKEPEESKDADDVENNEDGEEEEDVGEQEDQVKDEEQKFDDQAPETDALDLPEDINLDSEGDEGSDEEAEGIGEDFEDKLDENDVINEEENAKEDNMDVDMDKENEDGDEEEESVEGEPSNEAQEENETEEAEKEEENMYEDGQEINEEEGAEQDEQELLEADDQESAEKKEDKEGKEDDEIEGLDGAESGNKDEINEDTAVQQDSGVKSEGADADTNEEDKNVGASGGGADFQEDTESKDEEDNNEETSEQNDSSRDKASESLKQLGDSLKEFYRRRQEIKETTDEDMVDQKSGERPDEFQHLEGDNAENETQALGAANKDQIQKIDDNMAIDDDEDNVEDQIFKEEDLNKDDDNTKNEEDVDSDQEMLDIDNKEEDFEGEKRAAFIGERNRDQEADFAMKMEIDDEDDEDEHLSEDYENEYEMISRPDKEVSLRSYEEAQSLWKEADEATRDLTSSLCEQLRLILEPTLSTKLKGDYKTGKRLNMKRIIPYIASQFRKDKIWMRRTKPSKRQYQIMIAVDDSKSMAESKAVDIAFQSIALVSKALTQLESGQLAVIKFGEDAEIVHPFEKQFTTDSGVNVFRNFDFSDTKTDIKKLVSNSLKAFINARSSGDSDLWQLEIILSDGVCEDHETIQRLVRKAREQKVMLVFVVIDGVNNQESILDMSQVNYVADQNGQMKLQVNKYLDTFPFEFYVVVHNVKELPEMLALILRQYFTELASS